MNPFLHNVGLTRSIDPEPADPVLVSVTAAGIIRNRPALAVETFRQTNRDAFVIPAMTVALPACLERVAAGLS